MGVTFRSGGYLRHVYLGKRTVKDGEACAVWNDRGEHREVVGPRRIWMYNSTVRFLARHKAEAHQYLRVRHRDGRVQHVYGPASMYENPAWHDGIEVRDGVSLQSESDCIVVYGAGGTKRTPTERTSEKALPENVAATTGGDRERRVVRGPALFLPSVGETVHQFTWSGISDSALVKGSRTFEVLETGKNRVWTVTLPVTTSNLDTFSAVLCFRYQIESLERILEAGDPIERMFAALRADGQALGGGLSGEEVSVGGEEGALKLLSGLSSFPSLVSAAGAVGVALEAVSVTEVIHSDESKRRAKSEQRLAANLRSEKAEKEKNRELYDIDLEDRRKRIEREAELRRQEADATAKLEEETHAAKEAAAERRLGLERKEAEVRKKMKEEEDAMVVQFLVSLKDMGVDMTEFMCTAGGMKVGAAVLSRAAALSKSTGKQKPDESTKREKSEVFPAPIAW